MPARKKMEKEVDKAEKSFDSLIEKIQFVIVEIEKYKSEHDAELNINDQNWQINIRKQVERFTSHFYNSFNMLIALFNEQIQYFTKAKVRLVKDIMNDTLKSNLVISSTELVKTNFECALFLLLLTGDVDFRDSLPVLADYIDFAEKNKIDYKEIANRLIPLFESDDEVTKEFLRYFKQALD